MTQEEKQTAIPKLRFSEFKNENKWTTESLGSLATIVNERVGDRECVPMSITSGVGLVSQIEKFGRIIAGDSYKNYVLIRKNDFAYNKSATKEYPEGFIAHYSGDEPAAVPNSIFTCFRINGDSPDPRYLNYLFLGNLHGRWLRKFIEVGARAHGSLSVKDDDLLALPIPLPVGKSSLAEQQKIAECLSTLDELIEAESRKLDALKDHKKGLMQQLFPREGETRPRLRFPEFQSNDEWRTVPLSELLREKPVYGANAPAVPYSETLPTYLRITDIDDDGRFIRANKVSVAIIPSEDNFLRLGDIVLARTGASVGKSYQYKETDGDLVFAGFLIRLRPHPEKVVSTYLFNFLRTDRYWNWVRITSARSGQPGINSAEYSALPIPMPPDGDIGLAEQQRIADCLSSIDDLIAVQSDKLEALRTHKRGLMQQLLPNPSVFES